jgi:hypothetical protein
MLKTRPEDDSVNRTLKLEIDPDTLLGTVHAADCVCAFKITACSDENDELVPEDCLSQRLSAVVNASFVSIVTMDKDAIRVLLDVPIIHGWSLFEVFGRALDKNANHSIDAAPAMTVPAMTDDCTGGPRRRKNRECCCPHRCAHQGCSRH